jgi:hypothetical protein
MLEEIKLHLGGSSNLAKLTIRAYKPSAKRGVSAHVRRIESMTRLEYIGFTN